MGGREAGGNASGVAATKKLLMSAARSLDNYTLLNTLASSLLTATPDKPFVFPTALNDGICGRIHPLALKLATADNNGVTSIESAIQWSAAAYSYAVIRYPVVEGSLEGADRNIYLAIVVLFKMLQIKYDEDWRLPTVDGKVLPNMHLRDLAVELHEVRSRYESEFNFDIFCEWSRQRFGVPPRPSHPLRQRTPH